MYITPGYRKTFLIRFSSYFFMLIGFMAVSMIIEPVLGEEIKYQYDNVAGVHYVLPDTSKNSSDPHKTTLGSVKFDNSQVITPVSTDFGIVIPKINANAKVIPNVDPSNEAQYMKALSEGVAHAKGTVFPGQTGNIYLFSHSTDAPWNVVRYNAIFYLLGKLDRGDTITMFYQGRRYDYVVFDKTIVEPSDTRFLTDTYNDSVLTLQTCDPPGTTLHRLIIRAKLASENN